MIAFALVSSPDHRWFYTQLYSEEILVTYVVLSMVFIVMRKQELASIMIGLAFALNPDYMIYGITFLVSINKEFGPSIAMKSFLIIVGI